MADPRDFLLNTDYEMDKVIFYKSGSIMPDQNPYVQKEEKIADNNFGFIPLPFGVFSFHEDFSDTITDGSTRDDYSCYLVATSSGLYVGYRSNNANKKLYYRVYAFMPTNSGGNVGSTQKDAKQFILNTDYNYCKIYKKGTVPAGENLTITHNFGYTPLVLTWSSGNNRVDPQTSNSNGEPGRISCQVTNTDVKLRNPNTTGPLHYRIYYDEV